MYSMNKLQIQHFPSINSNDNKLLPADFVVSSSWICCSCCCLSRDKLLQDWRLTNDALSLHFLGNLRDTQRWFLTAELVLAKLLSAQKVSVSSDNWMDVFADKQCRFWCLIEQSKTFFWSRISLSGKPSTSSYNIIQNLWYIKTKPNKILISHTHTHTHTHRHRHRHRHTHTHSLTALCPGLPRWAGIRKVKPIWILLKQETVSGSGIS